MFSSTTPNGAKIVTETPVRAAESIYNDMRSTLSTSRKNKSFQIGGTYPDCRTLMARHCVGIDVFGSILIAACHIVKNLFFNPATFVASGTVGWLMKPG
ncbi:MAG: hypothetical protein KDD83_21575, partial [Caldilineaceae bacterium]|nr:hypothetical protein [Caldilineaceae bacterium]